LSAAVRAGVAAGIIASDPEDADRRISEGFQFIGIGHDVGLLSTTCRELCGRIHKEQATKG
jgi:2-keto-3-deoxy-L-rhamnonate aldolase RhmA